MASRALASSRLCVYLLVALLGGLAASDSVLGKERKGKKQALRAAYEQLEDRYRQWLEAVDRLITKEERELFLELDKDYQRDAFIKRFWKARDPYPRSTRNEFLEEWERRFALVKELYGGDLKDERSQQMLVNGHPTARVEISCTELWPVEVWYYDGREFHGGDVLLIFYQRWGQGRWRLWYPQDGVDDLMINGTSSALSDITGCIDSDALLAALNFLNNLGPNGAASLTAQLSRPADAPRSEWVASFQAYSTDLPAEAELFDADVGISFPGRYQTRTVVQGTVTVPATSLTLDTLGSYSTYSLTVTGEVLKDDQLFDSFRIKYNFPAPPAGAEAENAAAAADRPAALLPLVFERYLRPGTYQMILKVEDVGSGRLFRHQTALEVPRLDLPPELPPLDPETARILAEANAAIKNGETTIKIGPLPGEWQTGLVRIDAMTTGRNIDRVAFLLEGDTVLTKRSPPWNVELDLGDVPRARSLRVEAFDPDGELVASDELTINAGRHRFAVRLTEPRRGKRYQRSLRAEAEVLVPEGEAVARVEFFVNETPVATVYQPPWVQPIVLPENEPIAYVRAVAYTPDGSSTDDWVFVNAPDNLEELDIQYVELYTTVLDKNKRPVDDLEAADFRIFEDDTPQTIARFEQVRNLPIHAAVMLDVSASMEERLPSAQTAALRFFEQAITPKDRASVVTFNDHPELGAKFTNDVTTLAAGLAGLKAERGTALWDSLIFTLYYFNGIKGQRTILLLSDGRDENSRFLFEDALEYARRAGVTIYAIGIDAKGGELEKGKLTRVAEETGGRSFFIKDVTELDQVYATIQNELRSRYLITYQSTNTSLAKAFRFVEVELTQNGLEAKTLRGYYP